MSKLSFRARALDANKSLPVFHEEDVPDLPDIASVNRVVPQMPTGMEKEEETEHHLQRAISAQQIYGGSQRLIIPTPDAILYDAHYKQLIRRTVHMPKQLIHVQAFTLEDELPDYDCDEEDENWIENYNKKNTDKPINVLDFEKVIDTLEKSCSSRIDLFTLTDAQALVKKDENIVKVLFQYWKEKRLKGKTLTPAVRTEKKDGTALHDPYVAFRRRIEKMQTRKNRKNDESSYEKMLKLRRDLNRACLILEMVKQREEKKKDLLQTTIKILESRYANKDFSGELLHQCFELLKQRQMQQEHKPQPLQPSNMKEHGEHKKRSELIEEQKKRHKLLKQQQRAALLASSEDTELTSHNTHSRESDKSNEGPDGKYTFRRKKGVIYHAPRYDSMGNWPWTHPVEGGSGSSQYSYSKTSILKKCRCIGYARRRVGRGGRVNFDRAYSPYDDISTDKNDFFGSISSSIDERVPPWPHYKPHYDSSSDDEDKSDLTTSIQRLTKELSENCDSKNNVSSNKTTLYRSFSTQPSSRFRIHPYSKRRTSNGQLKKSRSSVNNQVFIAASIAASISKNVDSQSWILRRSNNNHQLFGNRNRKTTFSGSMKNPLTHHLSVSPPRPASTAPASAIYQLNFPITTKVPTASSTNSKVNTTVTNTNVNNNNTILRAIVKTSAQTSLHLNTSSDNSIVRAHSAAGAAALLQTSISRQPLSIVQQQSLIAAQQKIIPQSSVSSIQQGSILQVQPVLSNVRTNKINNIPKGLTINHNTVVSNGITTQPQSIQQLAR